MVYFIGCLVDMWAPCKSVVDPDAEVFCYLLLWDLVAVDVDLLGFVVVAWLIAFFEKCVNCDLLEFFGPMVILSIVFCKYLMIR